MQTQPSSRFVAYFDMLGIADLTLRQPEIAWAALSQWVTAKARIRGLQMLDKESGEAISDRIFDWTFSDSLVLMTRADDDLDLSAVLVTSLELFVAALAASIPIRGAIAHGAFMFNLDHGIFSGPPLVRAYRLGESAQWLGVAVDSVVARRYGKLSADLHCGGAPLMVEWNIPLKGGRLENREVLDWPRTHRRNLQATPPISVEDFYEAFEQLFGPFAALPEDVRAKYGNTTEFLNQRLAK